MLRATLKSVLDRKLRLLLSALAVLLGVAFTSGAFVMTDSMSKAFDGLFGTINEHVAVDVRGEKALGGEGDTRREIPDSLLQQVDQVDGVAEAQPVISADAVIVDKDGDVVSGSDGPPSIGTNWVDSQRLNPLEITDGAPPAGPDQIAIDSELAKDAGYGVGDKAPVGTPGGTKTFTIAGITQYTAEGKGSLGGERLILFDTPTAEQLLVGGRGLSEIQVAADDGVSQTELRDRIREVLPAGAEAITGDALADEQADDVQEGLSFFQTFLLVFAAVALFVGAFIIVNTFNILIAQRTRELALLRALGASRRQVNRSVLVEAVLIGVIASVLGLGAGLGVAVGLQSLFGDNLPSGDLIISSRTVIASFVVGVGVTVLASLLPARRASRVSPLEAMREAATPDRPMHRQVVVGVAMLVLGGVGTVLGLWGDLPLLVLGLSVLVLFLAIALLSPVLSRPIAGLLAKPFSHRAPGLLGRENARRNPRRTAATAAALMVGLALVSGVTVLGASLKTSTESLINQGIAADFVLSPETGVDPGAVEAARNTDGVGTVTGMQFAETSIDGKRTFVGTVSNKALGTTLSLEPKEGTVDTIAADAVLISQNAANSRDLAVGDQLPVEYPDGTTTELTVSGVYATNEVLGSYLLPDSADQHLNRTQYDMVLISVAGGASVGTVQDNLETALKAYPTISVDTRADVVGDVTEMIDQILTVVYALLVLSVVIAVLGIVNTLALSVLERTRELGLLRAVGMSRRQVKRMVRIESVVVSLFGGLLGVGVGIGLGVLLQQALAEDGLTKLSVPVSQLLLFLVLAAIAGVLAAWVPARRASRLNVLQAIATE